MYLMENAMFLQGQIHTVINSKKKLARYAPIKLEAYTRTVMPHTLVWKLYYDSAVIWSRTTMLLCIRPNPVNLYAAKEAGNGSKTVCKGWQRIHWMGYEFFQLICCKKALIIPEIWLYQVMYIRNVCSIWTYTVYFKCFAMFTHHPILSVRLCSHRHHGFSFYRLHEGNDDQLWPHSFTMIFPPANWLIMGLLFSPIFCTG